MKRRPRLAFGRMLRPVTLAPALALAGAAGVTLALITSGPGSATTAQSSRAAAPDADSPAGFYYGTDSWPIAINSSPPYREPVLSSRPVYGGYIGMAGNWARWSGCGGNIAWSSADNAAKLSKPPDKWCILGTTTCARFFGGVSRSSKQAVMWQWSGGGGITNGIGDFDQIDTRTVK